MTRRLAQRGNSLLEAVLFLPILMLLLWGLIEFGRITYTFYTLHKMSNSPKPKRSPCAARAKAPAPRSSPTSPPTRSASNSNASIPIPHNSPNASVPPTAATSRRAAATPISLSSPLPTAFPCGRTSRSSTPPNPLPCVRSCGCRWGATDAPPTGPGFA